MECATAAPAPLRCPTFAESLQATIALAPSGRAWPVNFLGGLSARYLTWLDALAGTVPTAAAWPTGYAQAGWYAAVASVRNFTEQRFCDLRLEFWCATHKETDDLWMREYGLPDACDPFPDLCTKVAAIGGTRCEYYVAIAARAGWVIDCDTDIERCDAEAGCMQAGFNVGGVIPPKLLISVDLGASDAYAGSYQYQPFAGCFQVGMPLACAPDISALKCIIERVVHAETEIVYLIIPPPVYLMADASTHLMADASAFLVVE